MSASDSFIKASDSQDPQDVLDDNRSSLSEAGVPSAKSKTSDQQEGATAAAKDGKVKSIILQVCLFILVTELCERLAYYGLTGSLPVFFSKIFKMSKALSTEMNTLFSSLNYVTPLLGAFVADKYIGRFKTIGAFCVLYVLGMVLCVLGSVPDWSSFGQPLFFVGLFLGVAVGAGGIKPNVVVLGADQFDLSIPEESKQKDRFFNYFYWCINIGAAVAFGALTNVAVNGVPPAVPETWGFFLSFLVPAVAMCVAVLTFFAGAKRVRCCGKCYMGGYKMVPPKSSALGAFLVMFGRAAKQTPSGRSIISAVVALLTGFLATIASYFIPEADSPAGDAGGLNVDAHFVVATLGMLCILYACMIFIIVGGRAQWMHAGYSLWAEQQALIHAKKNDGEVSGATATAQTSLGEGPNGRTVSYGATNTSIHDAADGDALAAAPVDQFNSMDLGSDDPLMALRNNQELLDACEVIRLLPYFAYIVVFWAVYGQMSNNFVVQGCQMNLFWTADPEESTSQVSSAFLNLFDTVVILAFIPIFDGAIYPCIARCRKKKGPLTVLEKVGSGFFFCTLSMITAGIIEILRKDSGVFAVDPCCANMQNATALDACCAGNTTCVDSCAYNSNCASEGSVEEMSRLSVWFQAFQFLLIGIAEILTSVSSYELFYTQVPESMRSICQALNLLTTSIGFMVTGGINSVFQFWIPNNLNNGKLENVYFVIGALSLFAGIGYIFTAQSFVYSDALRDDLQSSAPASRTVSVGSRSNSNDPRRGSSLDSSEFDRNRSVSRGSAYAGSRAVSFNPRSRLSSVNSQHSVRSRSRSRYTYTFSGLTCATGSEQTARALTLVPPPVNANGVPAPALPGLRAGWGQGPSRSVSGGRATALSELLVEEEGQRTHDPKARTTGLMEGYFGDGSTEKGEAGNV